MERLQADKVIEILKQHGTIVTVPQAKQIIDLLYELADIAVAECLREQDGNTQSKEANKSTNENERI